MNKAEELQALAKESDNKINKRTEKWINKKLIPFLEKMAEKGKYSVEYSDMRRYFYTTAGRSIDWDLKCCYFKKDINIDLVQTRLKEMGFYIKEWHYDADFTVYWDKEHTNSK